MIIANNTFKYSAEPPRKAAIKKTALAVAGLFIGAVNGLFGSGGGMLVVPALTFIAGLDEKHSHATAIAVILPLCLVSAIVYALKGGYDYSIFAPTIIGVVIGGVIGALILNKISNDLLSYVFYGLMLFAGVKMLA